MHAPQHADPPTRQRVNPTWNGHPNEKNEYILVHATRNGNRVADRKEPTLEPTTSPPKRPGPQHWTPYKQLAHARTLAKHSIQPYTDAAYEERMLQDWTKYETEIPEGHTGPPHTTPRTTWDRVVPERDIGALATTVRTPFKDSSMHDHPFLDDYDPAITNAMQTPTTAGPPSRASTSTPRTTTLFGSGTLLGHESLRSTCSKAQPPGHTASPAIGRRHRNRYRNHTYPPAQQNPTRPRRTTPHKQDRAHWPTKELNLRAPTRPSNISPSPSPHATSPVKINCPERRFIPGARQQHGDCREATSTGRKSSRE